jgi:signal transduction histidine kinase
MKTKLFFAFITLILLALISTMVFAFLIIKDFDNYTDNVKDDHVYWIIASIEDAYQERGWNQQMLSESVHWAMMMGLDIKILDAERREVIHAHHVMGSLPSGMTKRMQELFVIHAESNNTYNEFPLVSNSTRVGTLLARSFQKKALAEKEAIFRERVRYFLYVYLLIAGVGSILIGLLLVHYLSKPLLTLKKASEQIGEGDFSVRVAAGPSDEVGELARTFNKMAESLQREEALRKHLTENIAHELRTPLTIMKTHVEAMADGIVPDTRIGLENIGGEVEKLIALVKGIDDITAAEASFFLKGATVEINLKEFLGGLVREMLPAFHARGLYLRMTDEKDLTVTTEVEKLERILKNLLSNAQKYTDTGGATLTYGRAGNRLLIEIADTGRGIPENELPLIFNRFYRSGETCAEGVGLGLAIAKELADVMGGEISVTSEQGKGSIFRITLPFAEEPSSSFPQ